MFLKINKQFNNYIISILIIGFPYYSHIKTSKHAIRQKSLLYNKTRLQYLKISNHGTVTGTDCGDHFSGSNCQTGVPCTSGPGGNQCENNGTITGTGTGCDCEDHFSGSNCQTEGK